MIDMITKAALVEQIKSMVAFLAWVDDQLAGGVDAPGFGTSVPYDAAVIRGELAKRQALVAACDAPAKTPAAKTPAKKAPAAGEPARRGRPPVRRWPTQTFDD